MRLRLSTIGSVILCCTLGISLAAAQRETIDISRLERYEEAVLRSPANASYYAPYIDAEQQRIHSQLEKEVNEMVSPPGSTAQGDLDAAKALDRQRQVVADLTGRLNEDAVDLNLLKDEEKIYQSGKSASGTFMMTKSYPELLAKRVVLQEDSNLVSSALSAQQTRLQKLLSEDRAATMGLFLTLLWYLVVAFLTFWVEHWVRTRLILRISHRRLRYTLSKLFTAVVYLGLLVWLIQKILGEYPGLTTVLAVIGAALIFMLQDVIKSVLGWMTFRNALSLGQRVTIGRYTGDVLDIGLLFTTIIASRSPGMEDVSKAGKVIRVPNALLLTSELVNYNSTSDFENVEIPIYLADVRQWEKAQEILERVLREEVGGFAQQAQRQMEKRMRGFYFTHVSPSCRVYMDVSEKRELVLLLCFPAPIGQRRAVETNVLRKVLALCQQESIRIADPA